MVYVICLWDVIERETALPAMLLDTLLAAHYTDLNDQYSEVQMTVAVTGRRSGDEPLLVTRRFAELKPAPAALSIEAEAALRQFSQERLMAYGVDYADAKELRARVGMGEAWLAVARDLARTCLSPAESDTAAASPATTAERLYRASALHRMSQMMFLIDDDERGSILDDAVRLYSQASALSGDREAIRIDTDGGPLAGWLHPAGTSSAVGAAIVIGGVEGWAMDFGSLGTALARRGIHALLLDGPGQGQSRLSYKHYLTADWPAAYSRALDFLEERFGGCPLGFVGNSMGGSVATIVASLDDRVRGCINNGGPMYAARQVENTSFFRKMATHCGPVSIDQAVEVWSTVMPLSRTRRVSCPYLIVHGGMDPLVTTEEAMLALEHATAADRTMVTYSDGIHCIYNHEADKQDLMADWLASRLAA